LQPDLVHTNSLKAGVYGSLAANAAGIPVVWHLRDRIASDYLPRPAVRLVRQLVNRLADGVVANSTATLDTLGAGTHDRGLVHRVVPDSVEPSPYPRKPDSPTTTFGIVGRIAPWKGQDLFVRAFAAAFPAGTERAVIVGAPLFGEEACELQLRQLITRLGLAERVQLRGFREDVWSELARIDVLVHTSTSPEPFGQVVLEGMAAGLPVLAPDEGGPAEMIADDETGRLFAPRSVDALAAAMRALGADPRARERLGSAARRSIEAYHPVRVGEQLEEVYAEVLGR
jgi:glycosyltransferase involved in cell wall biosynthesis